MRYLYIYGVLQCLHHVHLVADRYDYLRMMMLMVFYEHVWDIDIFIYLVRLLLYESF